MIDLMKTLKSKKFKFFIILVVLFGIIGAIVERNIVHFLTGAAIGVIIFFAIIGAIAALKIIATILLGIIYIIMILTTKIYVIAKNMKEKSKGLFTRKQTTKQTQ